MPEDLDEFNMFHCSHSLCLPVLMFLFKEALWRKWVSMAVWETLRLLCVIIVALEIQPSVGQGSQEGAGLSEIDLEASKRITICTTQKKPLSCAYPGSNIAVTGVFWGRTSASVCPSDDGDTRLDCETAPETDGIVKAKCEGKESCELEARHALLQNPNSQHCPGVNKYLTVNYTCVPEDKEVVICDTENSTLNCPASWKIGINSVFWGRQSTTVCPSENGQTMCTGAPESLAIVKKSCDGLADCQLHAAYDQVQNGAENCPGVQKYLIINYACKPHPNIGTEEDAIIDNVNTLPQAVNIESNPPEKSKHVKPAPNVAHALKQMDSGTKSQTTPEEEGRAVTGDNVNLGRLGVGGLKALEKINNLIKASADVQGDENLVENGLTDDQAQAIERMIIEGIHHIKKNSTNDVIDVGAQRASIPRQTSQSMDSADSPRKASLETLKKLFPKALKRKDTSGAPSEAKLNPQAHKKEAAIKVGTPVLQEHKIVVLNKGISKALDAAAAKKKIFGERLNGGELAKVRPVPVLKSLTQTKQYHPQKLRSFGIGNAGAGNAP